MCNKTIDQLYKNTLQNFKDYVDLQYIKYSYTYKFSKPNITEEILENFLRKEGYVTNFVLGRKIFVKNFTCVSTNIDKGKVSIDIWTDKCNNSTCLTITDEILTYLPEALKYFNRI